jgi:DNA-binding NarL/FixJ family response regulator
MECEKATCVCRAANKEMGFGRLSQAFGPAPLLAARRGGKHALLKTLTPRERQLVALVCRGESYQEIATDTGHALGSIKNALSAIFGKLGVHSRSALIARVSGGADRARRGGGLGRASLN